VFSLRNPAARVISYYKSAYGQPEVATYGVGFAEFVTRAVAAAQVDDAELDSVSPDDRAFRQELTMSRYAGFLRQFLDAFGADRIRVCFFDSLTTDVEGLMRDLCGFAGIDPAFYDDYEFRVENQTRAHRHAGLRRLAGRINHGLEPLLNRFPSIRRAARRAYDSVNVDRSVKIPIEPDAVAELERFFVPANAELAEIMASRYPGQPLPAWLKPSAATGNGSGSSAPC
jgi:hypothetical protein